MVPSLFVAHGAPLLAIEDNLYTQFLTRLGQTLPKPRAIVIFSAHWVHPVQQVGAPQQFDTIYDFGGFPRELYEIRYPARSDSTVAQQVAALLANEGIPTGINETRGLDHGAWVVLRLLYPNVDVPVISMSVNPRLQPAQQYQIGKALSGLREEDVLVIGSGGTVHNLGAVQFGAPEGTVDPWAADFDAWLLDHVSSWDLDALFDYANAPGSRMSVPIGGNEHFVPLLYAMGAADDARTATRLHLNYTYGNLSHSVWQFG